MLREESLEGSRTWMSCPVTILTDLLRIPSHDSEITNVIKEFKEIVTYELNIVSFRAEMNSAFLLLGEP
jgi:hypothetical protein